MDSRYGGITYADNVISDDMYANNSKIIVWFENQAFHAMPSFLHEFYAMFSSCTQNSFNGTESCNLIDNSINQNTEKTYRIYNHPISLNDDRISYNTILQKVADIGISLTILCA